MRTLRTLLICIAGTLPLATHAASTPLMQPLSDTDMEDVVGQQGIALNLEFRVNMKADGQPVDASECPTVGALTGGSSCRMAFALPDLTGAWIVTKNFRGLNRLNNIWVDAVKLGGSTIHRDLTTYMGGYNPNDRPAMQFTAGNWATALAGGTTTYNNYLNSATYADFETALYLESLGAEFDSGSQPGYLRNAVPGAPLGLRIAHGNSLVPDPNNPPDVMFGPYGNEPAKIRLDGRLQIHGFGF